MGKSAVHVMKFRDLEGTNTSYLHKDLPVMERSEILVEFEMDLQVPRAADISILTTNQGERHLAEVILSPDNTFSLVCYRGDLYPSYDLYPSRILYPTQAGYSSPRVSLQRASSYVFVTFMVRNPGLFTDLDLYVEDSNRSGFASFNYQNWKDLDIDGIDLGCVVNNGTTYDFDMHNIRLEGDREGEWYDISGYQGFRTDVLWQAAIDTEDPSTYTSYKDLRKLARYDNARPQSTPTVAKGLKWRRNG